jgi:hypothetical protein
VIAPVQEPRPLGTLRVRDTIQRQYPIDVRGCLDRLSRIDRSARGRFVLTLAIRDDGTVASSTVESDAPVAPAGLCVAARARGWQFPARSEANTTVVHYPFVIQPNE